MAYFEFNGVAQVGGKVVANITEYDHKPAARRYFRGGGVSASDQKDAAALLYTFKMINYAGLEGEMAESVKNVRDAFYAVTAEMRRRGQPVPDIGPDDIAPNR